MIRAIKLDPQLYEEVEADRGAIRQALIIVVLVSLAAPISRIMSGDTNLYLAMLSLVGGLIGWGIWAFLTFILGVTLFKTPETKSSWGELARVTGFAQTPGLLFIFVGLPVIGIYIGLVASIWQLSAMVTGVKQALDYTSRWRAIAVVFLGFVIIIVLRMFLQGPTS
jgi:hypothetical protein